MVPTPTYVGHCSPLENRRSGYQQSEMIGSDQRDTNETSLVPYHKQKAFKEKRRMIYGVKTVKQARTDLKPGLFVSHLG
jgi:hypothetical protein